MKALDNEQIMNHYINIFQSLISHKESDVVEFKKAEKSFDFDDLGRYFRR